MKRKTSNELTQGTGRQVSRKAGIFWSKANDTIVLDGIQEIWIANRVSLVRSLILLGLKKRTIRSILRVFHSRISKYSKSQVVAMLKSVDNFLLTGAMLQWFKPSKWYFLIKRQLTLQQKRTVLSFVRMIRLSPSLDYQSITLPSTGKLDIFYKKYGDDFRSTLKSLLKPNFVGKSDFLSYPLRRVGGDEFQNPLYFSVKSGPNGPSALTGSVDLQSLINFPDQYQAVKEAWGYHGYTLPQVEMVKEPASIGRVVSFSDKGGKTRNIAILDAYSQLALAPLHRIAMETLRSIPFDYTHNQEGALKSILSAKCPKYSLDLKNATDRFPICLQKLVVDSLLTGFSGIWSTILVDRAYTAQSLPRKLCKHKGQGHLRDCPACTVKIKYRVGQPMGALSSWAIFSLTHHVVTQMAFRITGTKPIYWMLGDDVVIGHKDTADIYVDILNLLGVDISVQKSVYSLDGTSFEFAKRRYHNGEEATPLSVGSIPASPDIGSYAFLCSIYNQLSKLSNPSLRGKITLSLINKCLRRSQVKQWMTRVSPLHKITGSKAKISVEERKTLKTINTLEKVINISGSGDKLNIVGPDLYRYVGSTDKFCTYWLDILECEINARARQGAAHLSRMKRKLSKGGSWKAPVKGFKWSAETNMKVLEQEVIPWFLIPDLQELLLWPSHAAMVVNRRVMIQLASIARGKCKPLHLKTWFEKVLNV